MAGPRPVLIVEDDAALAGTLADQLALDAEFDSLEGATAWADSDPYVDAGVFHRVVVKPYKLVLP